MIGLYLFCAALGAPLVAWFLFSGGEDSGGGEGDGGEGGGGDSSIGAIMFRLLPLSTIALAVATFGVTGSLLTLFDTAGATTFVAAVVTAVIAGALNSTAFALIRGSDNAVVSDDRRLSGSTGRVVLPVGDERRGRIALTYDGQQIFLSAQAIADYETPTDHLELEVGAPVVVVEVRNGVALVARIDPELT